MRLGVILSFLRADYNLGMRTCQIQKPIRWGIGFKLGLIILAQLIVALLLLWMLLAEKNIALAFAQKELIGNRVLRPLRLLAESNEDCLTHIAPEKRAQMRAQAHRELDALVQQHGTTLQIQAEFALIHTKRGAPAHDPQLARMIHQLNHRIGDTSNLILDPDLDSYYMMDLILMKIPDEQEQLHLILTLLGQRGALDTHREHLRTLLGFLRVNQESQQHSLTTALENNPLGNLAEAALPRFRHKQEHSDRFLMSLDLFLAKPSESRRRQAQEDGEVALTSSYQLWEESSPVLDQLLKHRISGLERRQWSALVIVALMSLPTVIGSFFWTRWAARVLRQVAMRLESLRLGDITTLERGIVALAEGKRELISPARQQARVPLAIRTKDEIGALACSVNQLSEQAQITLDALEVTRGALERAEAALRESEEQMRFQAFHDALTGLPNRAYVIAQLTRALQRALRKETIVAVLFLDLDNFKIINDSKGHESGDLLLMEIAARLQSLVRPQDLLARLGGDEFLIVLEDLESEEQVFALAERLCQMFQEPLLVQGQLVYSGGSLGIAFGGRKELSASDLIKHADIAMYRAKAEGKHRYVVFDQQMNQVAQQRMALEADLRVALEEGGQLVLFYQPIYRLQDGTLSGVEALVRWQHPQHGMILPDRFIALAEETGLIVPLGDWVMRQACAYAHQWGLPMSINLSLQQLQDDGFVARVADILQQTHVSPSLIKLEVTESLLMKDPARTTQLLGQLKQLGVKIALDDFGVGYSSMAHLRDMPIDTLKIDRTFIRRLGQSAEDEAIFSAMVHMAQALNLSIVCEGIETELQQQSAQRLHCQYGQGFLFSRPRSEREVTQILQGLLTLPQAA